MLFVHGALFIEGHNKLAEPCQVGRSIFRTHQMSCSLRRAREREREGNLLLRPLFIRDDLDRFPLAFYIISAS